MKTTLLCLLGGLLVAAPQTAKCQFTFTTNNGALTVTGWSGSGTNAVIPDMTNGMPVVGIGDRAFYRLTGLTSVTIPNGVTNIGIWAFYYCSGLTNVTIPNSVTSIGDEAFAWCTSLTAIDVDPLNANFISMDGVLFNKEQTFLVQCPGGRKGSYTIPNSVASIGNSGFSSCAGLTNVPIPASVTSIGSNAFTSCHGLTSVTILNSVTNIGSGAFSGCAGLAAINTDPLNADYSSVDGVLFNKEQTLLVQYPGGRTNSYTITNSVTSIGTAAFYGCLKLPSVTIPSSVTNIGSHAFMNCTSLTNVTISNGVTSIGDDAFMSCTSLTNLTIPNSVTSIGDYAFASCSSLTSMTIPNSVTSIGEYAFASCKGLTSAKIPDSVTSIGGSAFYHCYGLTNVTIPNSVTSIGIGVFEQCFRLTGVTIGNGLTNITYGTFYQCSGLTNVTIPNSVTSIEGSAFLYCSKLKAAFFQGNAPVAGVNAFTAPTICYYLPGTSGWGSTYSGRPAYLWNPAPQTSGPSFGVGPSGFGFNITGTTNIPIVVEASTDLAASAWLPLQTCTLTNGLIYFSDPAWKNFPTRAYRIRSP